MGRHPWYAARPSPVPKDYLDEGELPSSVREDAVVVYIQCFRHKHRARRTEIDASLMANAVNASIDLLVLIPETSSDANVPLLRALRPTGTRLVTTRPSGRLRFDMAFYLANHFTKRYGSGLTHILCNSDIVIPSTAVDQIKGVLGSGERRFLCLTRWNKREGGVSLYNVLYSQDTWAWRGQINVELGKDIDLGRGGCDNALMDRVRRSGISVLNPSRSIVTVHVHESEVRSWAPAEVFGPYSVMAPHTLDEDGKCMPWVIRR